MQLWQLLFMINFFYLSSVSSAAPITFNAALPVSKNEVVIREQFIYSRLSNTENTSESTISQSSFVSTLVYGLTAKTTLFTTFPISRIEMTSLGERSLETGFGDSRITARYTAYQKDYIGKTLRVAPFIGAELATSQIESITSSNDIFLGLVITYANIDWSLNGQISGQRNGNDKDLKPGETLTFDVSFQYSLLPRKYSISTTSFLNGLIEINITKQKKNFVNENQIPESGGTSAFLSPGIQYITQRWILESSLQIPISQNNRPLKNDIAARTGIRINF